MTIQIIRKNDRYWIRRKAFVGWLYYNSGAPVDIWNPIGWSRRWEYAPEDFQTYAEAHEKLDKILAEHVERVVEKISPMVVEDSREL